MVAEDLAAVSATEDREIAAAGDHAIVAAGVGFRFAEATALSAFSIAVPRGAIFGLIGPDGAGKTTFVRLATGLLPQQSGRLRVLGRDPGKETRALRRLLGYMPQRFALYPDLSVIENLRFYADLFSVPAAQRRERLDRLLAFSRLGPFAARKAGHLSGGMRQKLALCSTLIHRPQLLLLDEPTTGVDPIARREFWDLLREIVTDGTTILLTTPYMDEAARCDQVALAGNGRVLAQGTPAGLLAQYPWDLIAVLTSDPVGVRRLCARLPGTRAAHALGDRVHVVTSQPEAHLSVLRAALAPAGVAAGDIRPARPSLEDLFAHLFDQVDQAAADGPRGERTTNGTQA